MDEYCVAKAKTAPELMGLWDGAAWGKVEAMTVGNYQERSTEHRPRTQAKLAYDADWLYAIWRVEDRYVRCTRSGYQMDTCKDSCVELFLLPFPDYGYFNFEITASGAMLSACNGRAKDGAKGGPIAKEWLDGVRIWHSLPDRVEPEIVEPTTWILEYHVPLDLFEAYVPPIRPLTGKTWRGNFYKIASHTSHPHWGSWTLMRDGQSFHDSSAFGVFRFV